MTLRRFVERLFWLSILPLLVLGVILIVVQVQTQDARRHMLAEAVVRTAARGVERDLEVQLASLTMLARLLEEEARHEAQPLQTACGRGSKALDEIEQARHEPDRSCWA